MRTTPAKPVFNGKMIRWTLEQIEQVNQHRVRADWLRFTVPLAAIVKSDLALLDLDALALLDQAGRDLIRMTRGCDAGPHTSAHKVAEAGAQLLCRLLGGALQVGLSDSKGMDYYTARVALMYEGALVGWVLAGGSSRNRAGASQAGTVHFNLFGSALLHVTPQDLAHVQQFIEDENGWITRVDLALDVWTGHDITNVPGAYLAGDFDVRGKRPGQREIGSWTLGHSRTFEVGSRGTGKLFRAYEKGHELFGHESGESSEWIRYEVEIRDKHRVIDLAVLTRPADYFAGAYPFCSKVLEALNLEITRLRIPTVPELPDKCAEAAVSRVIRWARHTALPAIVACFDLGGDLLAHLIDSERHRLPKRLSGIRRDLLATLFSKAADEFSPASVPSHQGDLRTIT
jgi:phage replication initiation protein